MSARLLASLTLIASIGCAAPSRVEPDPGERARRTVEGFREAGPAVAHVLAEAAAWAVFDGVEEDHGEWSCEGLLFMRDGSPRAALLRAAASEPATPALMTYHTLVVLADPEDLRLLERDGLELADAQELELHDEPAVLRPGGRRWVVTTARGGLLFPPRVVRHRLELAPAR